MNYLGLVVIDQASFQQNIRSPSVKPAASISIRIFPRRISPRHQILASLEGFASYSFDIDIVADLEGRLFANDKRQQAPVHQIASVALCRIFQSDIRIAA